MAVRRRKYYLVTRQTKCIFDIAKEVFGSRGLAARIMQSNPGVFRLSAGMILKLPVDIPQLNLTTDQVIRLDFAGLLEDCCEDPVDQATPPEINMGGQ